MVHLIKNYYAIPNNMGFTLVADKGRTDKEVKKVYETIGYCGNFEEVIFLLKRKVVDERLSRKDMELSEALDVIRITSEEIKAAVEKRAGDRSIISD